MIGSEFVPMAELTAKAFGIAGVPLAVYPGVIMADSDIDFHVKVANAMVPAMFDALLSDRAAAVDGSVEHIAAGEVVFTGDYDEVLEEFTRRGWTEGLPIVPPTRERVDAFLACTDLAATTSLGNLRSSNTEATVLSVAVNGVMAGCRPEFMPILVAVVEALADRAFGVEDAGSTPGWEPLITISGPLVRQLGFNSGAGALRVGNRANTSVGRFLRLYMRNVAGFRPYPDESDKGAISYTFNVALAEDEEVTNELGWAPQRVDRGFGLEDTTVTLRSVSAISAPIYSSGERADDNLRVIARTAAEALGGWAGYTYLNGGQFPLVILGPAIARNIAADGWTKDRVKQYLYENLVIDAAWVQEYARGVSGRNFDWGLLADDGRAPEEYRYAIEEKLMVRGTLGPDAFDIVVAGNPGRNQSRAYISNQIQGRPLTKAVKLPASWDEIRERFSQP
ncbi:hypothetical protein BKE56_004015 [Rhodococcus sp. M8]|nr:hypothetical protein BKE56_004015 [Rhodococcus sp. M8]